MRAGKLWVARGGAGAFSGLDTWTVSSWDSPFALSQLSSPQGVELSTTDYENEGPLHNLLHSQPPSSLDTGGLAII